MISIKQALDIRDGDKVHDFCGRHLEVKSYMISYEKGVPTKIQFGCRDIYTNENLMYFYDEIYIDFDDLCDENKLFLTWLRKDNECSWKNENEIKALKDAFMSGFTNGLSYRQKTKAEEQLQK